MNCPFHGKTEMAGVNALGFPVFKCCADQGDVYLYRDACARAPLGSGDAPAESKPLTNSEIGL